MRFSIVINLLLSSQFLLQGCAYNDLSHGEQLVIETVVPEIVDPLMGKAGDVLNQIIENNKYSNIDSVDSEKPHPDWPMVMCFGRVVHVNDC